MPGPSSPSRKRKAVNRISALRCADPAPISGLDALLINQVFFYDDPVRFTDSVNKIADELEERVRNKEGVAPIGTPRILLAGCPMAVPNWKLPQIVENSAVIVNEELCTGDRGHHLLTEETGETVDELLDNIVERYFQIHCAIFTPNPARLERINELYTSCKADGIIHYNLQFCQPYQVESGLVEKELEKAGAAFLRIDTDYSQEDIGQLQTRIEAFIEMIKG